MTMLLLGLLAGVIVTAIAVVLIMPRLMIRTHRSQLGYDETVTAISQSIPENGWSSPFALDMNASLSKNGVDFTPRVQILTMCQPEYAASVLATDRHVSCLMPCAVSVWEGPNGEVNISKMNTGLMGKLFGGNIARIMGGKVAEDEQAILAPVMEQRRNA